MHQHRRVQSLNGIREGNLKLFQLGKQHRNLLTTSLDASDIRGESLFIVPDRLSGINVEEAPTAAAKPEAAEKGRGLSGMEDLLAGEGEKHDYDWLLTPPGSPIQKSQSTTRIYKEREHAPKPTASSIPTTRSRSRSNVRSSTTTRQSEASISPRLTRSSSSNGRPSSSYSYLSAASSRLTTTRSNNSSVFVNSRPQTPTRRASLPAPTTKTSTSRPATPTKPRTPTTSASAPPSTPTSISISTSRPSTPSLRPPPLSSSTTTTARSNATSRPSTPTRRPSTSCNSTYTTTTATIPLTSSSAVTRPQTPIRRSPAGVIPRGRSPSPSPRSPKPAILPHDMPLDIAPPILRTTPTPERRPLSAARSRSVSSPSGNSSANCDVVISTGRSSTRRSSPSPARGRDHVKDQLALQLANGRREVTGINGEEFKEHQAAVVGSVHNNPTARPPAGATHENGGFGRNISKKSMDMALRHMDIKSSMGHIRSLSGTSLYPQSLRSSSVPKPKPHGLEYSNPAASRTMNNVVRVAQDQNGHAENYLMNHHQDVERINGFDAIDHLAQRHAEKLSKAQILKVPDFSMSARYDAMLLKEDLKNTEWLHGFNDQHPIFDLRFEPLPEPFGLL